ncbi:hypothetical protein MMC10_010800 [Thelotrema lepadinum]|nr:hypothetical protein [Thelotrema lepadinum]
MAPFVARSNYQTPSEQPETATTPSNGLGTQSKTKDFHLKANNAIAKTESWQNVGCGWGSVENTNVRIDADKPNADGKSHQNIGNAREQTSS